MSVDSIDTDVNMNRYENRGRSSWRPRGRGGRYYRPVRSEYKESDGIQTSQSTDLSTAAAGESSSTHHPVTAVNPYSSASFTSAENAARRSFNRGRGNRRPWQAKTAIRPIITKSTSDVASTADASESVMQPTDVCTAGISTVVNNCERNARQPQRGGLMDGTRAQLSSRRPVRWQSRARCGRNSHAIHSACKEPNNAQPQVTQSAGLSIAVGDESLSNFNAATSVSAPSSSSVNSCYSADRGIFKRGRGNRRPCWARSTNRPLSVPAVYECDYSSIQQVDDQQSSSDVVVTADANESVDVDIYPVHAAGVSAVAGRCRKNARQRGYRRQQLGSRKPGSQQNDATCGENDETRCVVTGSSNTAFESRMQEQLVSEVVSGAEADEWVDDDDNDGKLVDVRISAVASNNRKHAGQRQRQQLRFRKLASQQNDAVCGENDETQCVVTGGSSAAFESRMPKQLVSELVSNAETDGWVDDDDNDGNDDVLNIRRVPVASRGKHKTSNLRSRGFRNNRRGRSGSGTVREILDTEFGAHCIPAEAPVRDSKVVQGTGRCCNKSARCQKNSKPKASSSHHVREMASISSVSAAANGVDDLVVKTPVASEVKRTLDVCEKDSVSKPSVYIDENSLFWHLANEHNGKCCIDKLRNQLSTSDADNAVAFVRNLKRVKILVNESDKWMSVAFVFLKGLRMCMHVKSGCRNKKCTFLHVCPDYVTDSCHAGEQCRFGHSVRIPCNQLCLQKCGIPDSCSSESILTIARCSNPMICAAYNGVGESYCRNPLQCIQFHVCNYFFCGRCLIPDSKCNLGHELTSKNNERLLLLYEVNHLLKDEKMKKTLHRIILSFRTDFIPRSRAHVSDENIPKTLQTTTAQQANKVHISDFVAVVRPNIRTGKETPKSAECEVTGSVGFSAVSDDQLCVASVAQQSSIHKAKQPRMLHRFVVGQDSASEISDVPTSMQTTKLASDKCISFSSSTSSEKGHATGAQTDKAILTENMILLSNENESRTNTAQTSETVEASQPFVMPRFASRRSQSAKVLDNQCPLYEKHLCNERNDCSVRHDVLPYVWHVQDAGKWVAFDDSTCIEQAFCNPDNTTYHGATYQVHICISGIFL